MHLASLIACGWWTAALVTASRSRPLKSASSDSPASPASETRRNRVKPKSGTSASSSKQRPAFSYSDTSDLSMPKLAALLNGGGYGDVFSKSFHDAFAAAEEGSMQQQGAKAKPDAAAQTSQQEQSSSPKQTPFLYVSDPSSHTEKNCYIVKLTDSAEKDTFRKLSEVFGALDAKIHRTYTSGFKGYTICFSENILPLSILREIPWIEHVERENVIRSTQIQERAPWGLARLSSPDVHSSSYGFDATGRGVSVYVIDSGLSSTKELGNRGRLVYSAFPDSPADCSGHGTQVSSIIGGTNVGVAKQATLNVAQVLDCDGNGSNSDLIDAINWVIATHKKPAVINMSLGGPRSPSVDQAVRAAVDAGIPVVVAAGNENTDACTQSPAGVAEAFTIAAIAMGNTKAKFSNYGQCVDLFAPGVDILASAIPQKSRNGYIFGSGTSFSAPLVTGVVALFLEKNPGMTPGQVWDALSATAAKSVLVSSTLRGSPNLLLQAPSVKFKYPILVSLSDSSALPALGYHTSSIYSVELVLIIIAGICAVIAFFATSGTIYARYRSKRRAPPADIVPEADLKHSILSSQRPSVFL